MCSGKQGCYLFIGKTGYTAADACNKEDQFGILLRIADEIIHVGTNSLHAALHRRDGVALSCTADTDSPFGTKLLVRNACRSASVKAR